MTYEDAVEEWKSNDEWQFADKGACWKFMFEKGQESMHHQLAAAIAACKLKDALFEKIACLGNGNIHGNSIGNDLGKEGLTIQPDDSALKAWIGEPVGEIASDGSGYLAILNGAPVRIGDILYSPKGLNHGN